MSRLYLSQGSIQETEYILFQGLALATKVKSYLFINEFTLCSAELNSMMHKFESSWEHITTIETGSEAIVRELFLTESSSLISNKGDFFRRKSEVEQAIRFYKDASNNVDLAIQPEYIDAFNEERFVVYYLPIQILDAQMNHKLEERYLQTQKHGELGKYLKLKKGSSSLIQVRYL